MHTAYTYFSLLYSAHTDLTFISSIGQLPILIMRILAQFVWPDAFPDSSIAMGRCAVPQPQSGRVMGIAEIRGEKLGWGSE